MSEAILRLTDDEVWTALEAIDPVGVLAEELIDRTVGNEVPPAGKLSEWSDSRVKGADGAELVLLDHPEAAIRCVLPATGLRTFQAAALAALAARELLVRGGVTVAMLGASRAASPQLAVIARHVPDISHVAVRRTEPGGSSLPVRLTELLELSGIRLSLASTVAETVFGANLVVASDDGEPPQDLSGMRVSQLARGVVLINSTGRDLPDALVDQVDELYVDDLTLLSGHTNRHFVAAHLAKRADRPGVERAGPRIDADLGLLLAGRHVRAHADNTVLVELLGVSTLNVRLAYRIQQAAERAGLGSRVRL
ncbi:MAG: hypothetical protein ACRDSK_22830 [Actinophytocola sp.]|uniref:hypothetical protein n=1 Tax=Actinophytocola sp. TaxID=1872138 RepID=UPI003D6C5A28